MDIELAQRHRLLNRLQSVLLLLVMAALLVMVGWLFAGALGVAWSLVLAVTLALLSPGISPRFILRMYQARELSPSQAPGLRRVVAELARRADLSRMPQLCHVASPVLNAFALGHSGQSYLVVSEGILRKLTPRELTGVLAHEISHIRHNDTPQPSTDPRPAGAPEVAAAAAGRARSGKRRYPISWFTPAAAAGRDGARWGCGTDW